MIRAKCGRTHARAVSMRGVTLVELMVSLVLGLILTGAALTLFVTNRETYTASESLGRVQESARIAFELMARDVREAASNQCDNSKAVNNGLKNAATYAWWSSWGVGTDSGLKGYGTAAAFADDGFGTAAGKRVNGTPALEFESATPTGSMVTSDMTDVAQPVVVNALNGIASGDLIVICDFNHVSLFQVSSIGGTTTLNHAAGGSTPGNATGSLPPDVYKATAGNIVGATLAKMRASRWYIGNNGRGSRSLYQASLRNVAGTPTVVKDEIAEGVDNMSLQYLENGGTSYTATPADWSKVQAIKVGLTFKGQDRVGTDSSNGNVLQRTVEHVIALRERAP